MTRRGHQLGAAGPKLDSPAAQPWVQKRQLSRVKAQRAATNADEFHIDVRVIADRSNFAATPSVASSLREMNHAGPDHPLPSDPSRIATVAIPAIPNDEECATARQRTLTNLYNDRPTWLDMSHQRLDAAVAAAYGWPPDLTDDEILSRLLALNLERMMNAE